METLSIPPGSASYSVHDLSDRLATRLDGPQSSVRANFLNRARLLDVAWSCTPAQYATLRVAARRNLALGGPPFQVQLVLDSAIPAIYVVKFVPGTLSTQNIDGIRYEVKAQVYAMPTQAATAVTTYPAFPGAPAGAILLMPPVVSRAFVLGSTTTWFKVENPKTQNITISTVGTLWDTEIGAYDVSGKLLSFDDDSGIEVPPPGGFSSVLTLSAAVAGTYYFVVGPWEITFGTTRFNATSAGALQRDLILSASFS